MLGLYRIEGIEQKDIGVLHFIKHSLPSVLRNYDCSLVERDDEWYLIVKNSKSKTNEIKEYLSKMLERKISLSGWYA